MTAERFEVDMRGSGREQTRREGHERRIDEGSAGTSATSAFISGLRATVPGLRP